MTADDLWDAHDGQPCASCGLRLEDVYEPVVQTGRIVIDDPLLAAPISGDTPSTVAFHVEPMPPRTIRRWVGVRRTT